MSYVVWNCMSQIGFKLIISMSFIFLMKYYSVDAQSRSTYSDNRQQRHWKAMTSSIDAVEASYIFAISYHDFYVLLVWLTLPVNLIKNTIKDVSGWSRCILVNMLEHDLMHRPYSRQVTEQLPFRKLLTFWKFILMYIVVVYRSPPLVSSFYAHLTITSWCVLG